MEGMAARIDLGVTTCEAKFERQGLVFDWGTENMYIYIYTIVYIYIHNYVYIYIHIHMIICIYI